MTVSSADMDLSLDVVESEGRLIGRLEYSADLFDHSTVERMGGHLQARRLLEGSLAQLGSVPDALAYKHKICR